MKNLLKSTLYLSVFALAGILFQISCSNSENKNVAANVTTAAQNKIILTTYASTGQSIWICNYDGTNLTQVPITLPANLHFATGPNNADAKLTSDGQKIIFLAGNSTTGNTELYSCDIAGTNIQLVAAPNNAALMTYNLN